MNSRFGTPLALAKEFCRRDFIERSAERTALLLSRDIRWFGTAESEDVHNLDEAERYLQEEIAQSPEPYALTFSEEWERVNADGSGIAYAKIQICGARGLCLRCRMSAATCVEDGEHKICTLHMSIADNVQQEGEFFPVSFAKEHEEKLRQEFVNKTVACGMIGCYARENFPFYFINHRMLEYLGYENEAQFGQHIDGMLANCIHPEDLPRVSQTVWQGLAEQGEYAVDCRIRKKDGSYFWAHNIGKATTDGNGERAVVAACYDITDQQRAQTALAANARELEKTLNSVPGGVAVYRWDGHDITAVAFNSSFCRMMGATEQKLLQNFAQRDFIHIHPEDRARARCHTGILSNRRALPLHVSRFRRKKQYLSLDLCRGTDFLAGKWQSACLCQLYRHHRPEGSRAKPVSKPTESVDRHRIRRHSILGVRY